MLAQLQKHLEKKDIWISAARVFVVALLMSALFPVAEWAAFICFALASALVQHFQRKREQFPLRKSEWKPLGFACGVYYGLLYVALVIALGSFSLMYRPILLAMAAGLGTVGGLLAYEKLFTSKVPGIGN